MEIKLYLISPHQEYANYHACRKHWNFQWGGRRGTYLTPNNIKIRKESFGGLMQAPDEKIYKLDHEAYFYLNIILT